MAVDAATGVIYVADATNSRIQRLASDGSFIGAFGWNVNRTISTRAGSSRRERDICTATSGNICGAGTPGHLLGQILQPFSLTVDQGTGDVYVFEAGDNMRVDRYSPQGRLIWTVGAHASSGGRRRVAFKALPQYGDLLAVGGQDDLLYVGDEHRVVMLGRNGAMRGEILLASLSAAPGSTVTALARDRLGNTYLVYSRIDPHTGASLDSAATVRRLDPSDTPVGSFEILPKRPQGTVYVDGIASGENGLLAAIGVEVGPDFHIRFGLLYDGLSGHPIGEFVPPRDNDGLVFDSRNNLYVAATDTQEIDVYAPEPSSNLLVNPMPCSPGPASDRAGAFECLLDGDQLRDLYGGTQRSG